MRLSVRRLSAVLLAGSALAGSPLAVEAQPPVQAGAAHPALWPAAKSPNLVDAKTETFVSRLMARMSLEEKVGQVVQADISSIKPADLAEYPLGSVEAGGDTPPLDAPDRSGPKTWLDTVRAFRGVAMQARPGHTAIPLIFGIDAVHGHNNVVGATLFPHNIALGAAHDPELLTRIGQATAQEVAATGIEWAYGPTLAVVRDDRWGRTYEGYSEDPEITRAYAGAVIRGLQGEPGSGPLLQSGHVVATAKHFIGDGGTRNGHDQGDNPALEPELIRLNAPGYVSAVDAGVMSVMASFSSWQGVKMHANAGLLTGVLKGRMGFDGFVVGDWNAHGQVPGCTVEDCPAAVNAGVDMVMAADSWKGFYRNTLAEVRAGKIPMARLDEAVRRVLRVKAKAGLFDASRPWEGRFGVIGSPEHRAIAREAVRKSLVLLKNNGGVLPIRGSAHVLIAGDAADDIGRQAGGWTLSWQGTGNTNADFPGATSIYTGLRNAVTAAGGSVELSPSGAFSRKPDVAIVVFGETPYAEFQGDLQTLEYQPGAKTNLALLKRLKAQGVPVVSIFLSGRPLWINPELNASDAFVAAWLPGSEGDGVADLLIGDSAGRPRTDFQGRLGYSWPKSAAQTSLNRGDASYDPLFAYGYGLTYRRSQPLARLSEASGVAPPVANIDRYFVGGRTLAPWRLAVQAGGRTYLESAGGAEAAGVISLRLIDANGVQEAGRTIAWSGAAPAAFVVSGPTVDLDRRATAGMALLIRFRLDAPASAPVRLGVGCGPRCGGAVDLGGALSAEPAGRWRTVKVKLACLRSAGAELGRVSQPVVISTAGRLRLSLAELSLTADQADAICPPAAP